jgi:protein gp37
MNRTKIEWADYTWNPIKGLCPEACWYCYARRMYQRFGMDETMRLDLGTIWEPTLQKKPSRIFLCSTFELFHPLVGSEWRDWIFTTIKAAPQHTFIVLTKRPERIDRPMPDNVWLGVSVTGDSNIDYLRTRWLEKADAKVKFVSFEPLLGDPCIWDLFETRFPQWMIVGRLTGHGRKNDPALRTLTEIVNFGKTHEIPVFLKNNLKDIWPAPLIQEFPE